MPLSTIENQSYFSNGIVVEVELPVRLISADDFSRQNLSRHNQIAFMLNDILSVTPPSESANRPGRDYTQLDMKLNVVIYLLAELLENRSSASAKQKLTISADALSIVPDQILSIGQQVLVELYLDEQLKWPIKLVGSVVEDATARPQHVTIVFDKHDLGIHECFEKWLFQLHRRDVQAMHQQQD